MMASVASLSPFCVKGINTFLEPCLDQLIQKVTVCEDRLWHSESFPGCTRFKCGINSIGNSIQTLAFGLMHNDRIFSFKLLLPTSPCCPLHFISSFVTTHASGCLAGACRPLVLPPTSATIAGAACNPQSRPRDLSPRQQGLSQTSLRETELCLSS